jgi:hypothetical protein
MQQPPHDRLATVAKAATRRWRRQADLLGLLRLLLVLAALVVGYRFLAGDGLPALLGLLVSGLALGAVSLMLGRRLDQARLQEALVRRHSQGQQRLAGNWRHGQADGSTYLDAGWHPYARDLDVVGPWSLFELLNTTGSELGGQRLIRRLLDDQPGLADTTLVRRLQSEHAWREILAAQLSLAPGADGLDSWQQEPKSIATWWSILTWCLRLLVLALLVAAWWQSGIPGAIVVGILFALILTPLNESFGGRLPAGDPDGLRRRVEAWSEAARHVCRTELIDTTTKAEMTTWLTTLEASRSLAGALAARANPLWRYLVAPLYLADASLVERLRRWQRQHARALASGREQLADVEVQSAIATYAAEQGGCWAEEAEAAQPLFDASELAHPLLPRQQRISNPARLATDEVLLLTGANASGKSTYLRTVGLAVLLARIGAPVPAASCRLQPMRLAAVMRVQDDLHRGLSRFQAEVGQLKAALDHAAEGTSPVLFFFDEILAGTNSRERHLGTAAILKHLAGQPGAILVTTHDLALAELATEQAERIHLAHFADRAAEDAEDVAFDYHLREGVLASTNALKVMRAAGLPV